MFNLRSAILLAWLRSDPLRVMEAVITGVSFLGAGTIIRGRGQRVEGLTTAAAMLAAAAIGMSVGVGHVALAALLTAVVVAVLRLPTGRGVSSS
ncbi:MAG: MgtC/SapB family protein [Vicinamibacterales bacterium]